MNGPVFTIELSAIKLVIVNRNLDYRICFHEKRNKFIR